MKRRTFLSTTCTLGIAGAASGTSIVSSAYTSLSTRISLKEFSTPAKTALDHFTLEIAKNVRDLGLDQTLIDHIAIPVRIIKKQFTDSNHCIVYKNKAGNYISLRVKYGVESFEVSKA